MALVKPLKPEECLELGGSYEFTIVSREDENGQLMLSRRRILFAHAWDKVSQVGVEPHPRASCQQPRGTPAPHSQMEPHAPMPSDAAPTPSQWPPHPDVDAPAQPPPRPARTLTAPLLPSLPPRAPLSAVRRRRDGRGRGCGGQPWRGDDARRGLARLPPRLPLSRRPDPHRGVRRPKARRQVPRTLPARARHSARLARALSPRLRQPLRASPPTAT